MTEAAEAFPVGGIEIIERALERYRMFSDGSANVHHLMYRYYEALKAGGEAAIEIGVRAGGVSAMMNMIAAEVVPADRGFMVFSIDPYGSAPYRMGHGEVALSPYHDGFYLKAKDLLLEYERSTMLRMESQVFIERLLRHYRWWFDGKQHPAAPRWVTFAYLDGQHGSMDVMLEVESLLPVMVPGGLLAIDDINYIPDVVAWVKKTYVTPFIVEEFPASRLGITIPKDKP